MTGRYAVIGDPVSHSLSPLMHQGWIADHGLDATYEALLLRADDPIAAIRALKGYAGVNVTVPHKEAAARAADRSEGPVANVLRWEGDGSVSAFNTDGAGFLNSLNDGAPGWRERVKTALVLGAGGAAQGIGAAIAGDVDLIIANRTHSRAADLAGQLPRAGAAAWDALPACFADADLIVNATTIGLNESRDYDWPIGFCRRGAIVVDIVYRPLETALLRAARAQGLVAIDGLGMLIHQGALAFELWHGIAPDTGKARERLLKVVAP